MPPPSGAEPRPLRIVLVDDLAATRQGLRMAFALEPRIHVAGEASNGAEALATIARLRPDLVVMDVEMPDGDGIETTRHLRARGFAKPIVLLSIHDDSATRASATSAGASAFVTKHEGFAALMAAIRAVGPVWNSEHDL